MKKFLMLSLVCLAGAGAMSAIAMPEWSTTSTVKTIMGDSCNGATGAAITAFYLEGHRLPYFFPETSSNSKSWLSMLETAMATGTPIQVKYETAEVNPGPQCTFTPGFKVYVITVNP